MSYLIKKPSELVGALESTARAIKETVNFLFRENGIDISYEQYQVLVSIYDNPGCTQVMIAKSCDKEPASISRIINILSKKRLIRKRKDDINKRINRIILTNLGEIITSKSMSIVESVANHYLEDIYDQEVNVFLGILNRIQQN